MSRYFPFIVLLALGALWGSSFLFIKVAVAELQPETVVAGRLIIAALILLAVLRWRKLQLPASPRMWGHFLVVGICGVALPFVLITWSEQAIPSGQAAILNATTPLFATLIGYAWIREDRMSGLRLFGIVLGFAGVVVAVGVQNIALGGASLQGVLAVLVAAACYGFASLYGRRMFHGLPPLIPAAGQMCAGAVVITPIALVRYGLPVMPSFRTVGSVLALALFCTAIAYVLLYWLIGRLGATRASMVAYLLPPFALLYGGLFLGERVGISTIAGLLLVFAGILLANGVLRWPQREPQPASTALPRR